MNYPYAVVWTGALGGPGNSPPFRPACPMLYCYGLRKPFQFQSPSWLAWLAAQPGSEVHAFRTGHWVMLEQPALFNERLGAWLSRTPIARR
jgi:pimeloyl-ACP methyl ester carboxylesterase